MKTKIKAGPKPKQRSAKPIGIRIDIETRSGRDLRKSGVYPYAEDPAFAVLTIGYAAIHAYPGGETKTGRPRSVDLSDPQQVAKFQSLLRDEGFQKHAFNAAFERVALSRWLGMETGEYLDPTNWHCSSIRASVNGVFGSLEEVARALRSPVNKDPEGKALIKLFSVPDKATGAFHETGPCWCGSEHTHAFGRFVSYCEQDVLTEAGVAHLLPPIPDDVQAQYEADQRINDRGFRHHEKLSRRAVVAVEREQARLMTELKVLTGLDNPNSGQQMQGWLEAQKYPMSSLAKDRRAEALDDPFCPPLVKRALELKGAASLSSVAKHQAALNTRCQDGRIRGSLQFYGAHTGREAGRGIQPQNLPRYEASDADRKRLLKGKAGTDAPQIAKGSVRASILPAPKHVFLTYDYNAIEARCLGWQAEEGWVQREFAGEGKIYEATAEMMFGVSKAKLLAGLKACDKCGACSWCVTRNQGKVSNLALGYGGAAGALVTMGAADAGLDIGNYLTLHREWENEGKPGKFHEWQRDRHNYPALLSIRDLYRDASPMTVRFWKQCAAAWDRAALTGKPTAFGPDGRIQMIRDGRHNRLILPSGRSIWYRFARSLADEKNPDRIDRRTFVGKSGGIGHTRIDTHGGSLTENITQAVARDVLFDLIMKIEALTAKGWPARLVLHVHDEVVLEVKPKHVDQVNADLAGMMSTGPDWAPGLLVKGEGAVMTHYRK